MKKSNYGDGAVYQRSDGRWVAVLRHRDGKRQAIYGKTEREARRNRRDASERVAQDHTAVPSKRTFAAVAQAWLDQAPYTERMKEKSLRVYSDVLRLHVNPVIGKTRIASATPDLVVDVLKAMKSRNYSPGYQGQAHKAMSHVFQYAIREGLLRRNPCRDVVKPSGTVK